MSGIQGLAQLATGQIVNCLLLGLAMGVLAGIVAFIIPRQNSSLRFALWFSALIAVAFPLFVVKPFAGTTSQFHGPEISLPAHWAIYIFAAWASVAGVLLMRTVRGLFRVRALRKKCVPLDESNLLALLGSLPETRRRFAIVSSPHVRVPAAIGFFRPLVVLPTWTLTELSEKELNAVLLHEAAHLERWDDWTNLLQKIIRALLFFHPAVWWIDNQLSIERELSCDDLVLAHSQDARNYAGCLISLAEKTAAHRALALAQAAVSRLRQMTLRISRILDGKQRRTSSTLKPSIAAMSGFVVIAFLAAQHTPQVVGFGSAQRSTTQTASSVKFDYVVPETAQMGNTVPASLHEGHKRQSAAMNSALSANRAKQHSTPERNWASANDIREQRQTKTHDPRVVNASLTDGSQPAFIYLVRQSAQYDSLGNVLVTTTVWRIPVNAATHNGVTPHST